MQGTYYDLLGTVPQHTWHTQYFYSQIQQRKENNGQICENIVIPHYLSQIKHWIAMLELHSKIWMKMNPCTVCTACANFSNTKCPNPSPSWINFEAKTTCIWHLSTGIRQERKSALRSATKWGSITFHPSQAQFWILLLHPKRAKLKAGNAASLNTIWPQGAAPLVLTTESEMPALLLSWYSGFLINS